MGRTPSPHSGNAWKKTFFSVDVFPYSSALYLFEKRKTTIQFLPPRATFCLHIERFRKEESEDAKLRRGGRVTIGMDQHLAKKIITWRGNWVFNKYVDTGVGFRKKASCKSILGFWTSVTFLFSSHQWASAASPTSWHQKCEENVEGFAVMVMKLNYFDYCHYIPIHLDQPHWWGQCSCSAQGLMCCLHLFQITFFKGNNI